MKKLPLPPRLPGEEWGRWKKAGFWGYQVLLVLLASAGVAAISLVLALGSYPLELFWQYTDVAILWILNLLPVLGLGILLYGILGRAQWSFLLTAAVVLGFSTGNYFKIAFRDDPLLFGDLLYLREAGDMAGKYPIYLDRTMEVTILCVVLGFAALAILARGRPKKRLRLSLILTGAAILGVMIPVSFSDSLYEGKAANYDHLESKWSATEQYIAHGFVYPFLHSISDVIQQRPEDYDKADAQQTMSQYEDVDIPEDKKVNVIGIMLESYNDFTELGAPEFATDIYETWHALQAEGYSGHLVTNIFAGGTIDTERAFLTGYSNLPNFRGNTNAYPWYFRSQGYKVEGMHPCYQWFYNRVNINQYLGFSEYYFMENYFDPLSDYPTAGDNILFPELLKCYQNATAEGTPYFNFSVTYQGHGPYSGETFYWGNPSDYVVNDGRYTTEQHRMLSNYFAFIQNTNENLKEFTDALRADDDPVVLVLFGDHNPGLGDALYDLLEISLDQDTQEGFLNYYATPYIIWANDAAKEILGNDFQGTGPDVSPCFLMNEVFSLCGWTGPAYLQATNTVAQYVPVVHGNDRYLLNGVLVSELSGEEESLVKNYRNIEYYWQKNFVYGKEG